MTELGFPRLVRQGWLSVHAAREAAQVSAGLWCSRPAWCRERADATSRSKGRPGERRRYAASQGCSTCGTTWGRESWRGDFNTSAVRRPGRIRARSLRAQTAFAMAVRLARGHCGVTTATPFASAASAKRSSYVTSPSRSSPKSSTAARCTASRDRIAGGSRRPASSNTPVLTSTRVTEFSTARAWRARSGTALRTARMSSVRTRSHATRSRSASCNQD